MQFPVEGFVAPGFERVREVFRDNFEHGAEVGASFSVQRASEVLVDLWGGYQDRACTRPWLRDTLVNVYSTGKGPAAAAVAAAVDDGKLDYDAPVRDYWPELRAATGGLTVSQLLSHQAGLCGVDDTLAVTDLYDWSGMCRRLECQAPYWPPGTAAGFHAVTWGYLAGELVRRATGLSLGTLLRVRVAEPLGADFHIGLPASEHYRVADLIGPNRARLPEPGREARPQLPPLNAVAMQNPSFDRSPTRAAAPGVAPRSRLPMVMAMPGG
ncbi:MAG: serine hydrolase domain-containing protein [Pseudomonadales bacterium]